MYARPAMKDVASTRAGRVGVVRARLLLLMTLAAISAPELASAYSTSTTMSEDATCPAESAACLADAKCYECFFVLSASAEACTPEGFEVDSATCDEKLQRSCCSIEAGEDCEDNAVLVSYLACAADCDLDIGLCGDGTSEDSTSGAVRLPSSGPGPAAFSVASAVTGLLVLGLGAFR